MLGSEFEGEGLWRRTSGSGWAIQIAGASTIGYTKGEIMALTSCSTYHTFDLTAGDATPELACGRISYANPLYSADTTLAIGTILRTAIYPSTSYFEGGELWYKEGMLGKSYQIAGALTPGYATGEIMNITLCSSVTTESPMEGNDVLLKFGATKIDACTVLSEFTFILTPATATTLSSIMTTGIWNAGGTSNADFAPAGWYKEDVDGAVRYWDGTQFQGAT
jgi:hypothetical protein